MLRSLTDTVYNMNGQHLAPEVPTVFERLDDAGLRTAGTTYLIYRGRHRHQLAGETALARIAGAVFRESVLGPRELFYADLFASRRTGCRGQLGMPGQRDQHSGCVGAHLVEHDLFDFLLFSLPDNDAFSHRNGPHAQVASIAAADRQLERLVHAGGGLDRFLEEHAMIVLPTTRTPPSSGASTCRSRSRSGTSRSRAERLARGASAPRATTPPRRSRRQRRQIALGLAQRSAMIYVLDDERRATAHRARRARGRHDPRRRPRDAADRAARGRDRRASAASCASRPGGDLVDLRGRRWSVDGDARDAERARRGRRAC